MNCPGISGRFGLSVLHETGVARGVWRALWALRVRGGRKFVRVAGGRGCGWLEGGAADEFGSASGT
jgi:hypothetical protein